MKILALLFVLPLLAHIHPTPEARPVPGECRPAVGAPAPADALQNSLTAMGITAIGDSILHYKFVEGTENNFQSDRSYPPFFSAYTVGEAWTDATGLTERMKAGGLYAGNGPSSPRSLILAAGATYALRDTIAQPVPGPQDAWLQRWSLNPWLVVRGWSAASDVRVTGECTYRDFPRLVLERTGAYGREQLYLDRNTFFPIKLHVVEPHYLWGQVDVEYVYSNWSEAGRGIYPLHTFRIVDGATEVTRSLGDNRLLPRDSVPAVKLPPAPAATYDRMLAGFSPPPDTVRVSANTFLLRTPMYTQVATLQRDTIWLLDATTSELRARADSAWIGKLFPGTHPVALVVTDLAWPHLGGLRFWVASGATIVSHRASRPFLERIATRKWTTSPDRLEQRRASARFRFRAVEDSAAFARGDVRVLAINGIGSEGAVMVYLPNEQFLWASDYIQTVRGPSQYAREVWQAVQRAGIQPARTAAQHLPLTDWSVVTSLNGSK